MRISTLATQIYPKSWSKIWRGLGWMRDSTSCSDCFVWCASENDASSDQTEIDVALDSIRTEQDARKVRHGVLFLVRLDAISQTRIVSTCRVNRKLVSTFKTNHLVATMRDPAGNRFA